MKKLTLIAFGFLISVTTFGQACKKYLEKDAKDSFTEAPAVFSASTIFSQPTITDARGISFRVLDNNRFFFHLETGQNMDLVYGSDVILIFDDGEQLTLQIEQMSRAKVGTEFVTHANCRVYFKHDVERFYNHHITTLKLLGSRQEYEIDKTDQTKILASALCVVETVGIGNLNFSSERGTALVPDGSGASFLSGSSSVVIMSGTVKCDFEIDTLIGSSQVVKKTNPKELSSVPHKLTFQIGRDADKMTLYLKYAIDLGNINKDSYIIFKFSDGTQKTFKHKGDAVNDEKPTFEIDISLYKEDFMNKDISAVRISYSEYFVDLAVSSPAAISNFLRYCF